MKNSKEIAETVFKKRDEHLKNSIIRQQRMKKIAYIGSTACVCIIIIGAIHINKNGMQPPHISDYSVDESIQSSTNVVETSKDNDIQTNTSNKNSTSESTEVSQTINDITTPTKQTEIVDIVTDSFSETNGQSSDFVPNIITTVEENTNTSPTEDETATEPKWNEMTLTQQFPEFVYNNKVYGLRNVTIENEYVGDCIDNLTLSAFDYTSDKEYSIVGDIYEIKEISDMFSVALKFENCPSYYVYCNSNYVPDNLGMLLDDLNIENTLVLGDMYIGENSPISDYSKEKVLDLLLNNRECECTDDDLIHKNAVSFSANINLLGIENKSITLTEDGFIITNVTEHRNMFYVGESAINDFCESLSVYNDYYTNTEFQNPTGNDFTPE